MIRAHEARSAGTAARARRANDWMWESLAGRGYDPIPFFCECGTDGCYEPVWLTAAQYAHRRIDPSWRVMAGAAHPRGGARALVQVSGADRGARP